MSLEDKFRAAVKVIKGLPKDGSFQPSTEVKLQFYSLYKQATEGPCSASKPGWWDVEARTKYNAWNDLKNMDRNTAMSQYIELIKQIVETMTFSSDVEGFMEIIGPFYEAVEEDQSDSKDPSGDNNLTDDEHEDDYQTLEQMIGRYVPPENGLYNVEPDEDFIKQYPCKGDAMMLAKQKSTKKKISRKKSQLFSDSDDSDSDLGLKISSNFGDENGNLTRPESNMMMTMETMTKTENNMTLTMDTMTKAIDDMVLGEDNMIVGDNIMLGGDTMMIEGDNIMKEIEETKKALDATQEILDGVKAERAKMNCGLTKESLEDDNPSQLDLDRMLGRYDGFVPPQINLEDLQISLDHDDQSFAGDIIDGANNHVIMPYHALEEYNKIVNLNVHDEYRKNSQINFKVNCEDSNDSLSSDDEIFEDPMTEDFIDSGISEELESNKSFNKSIDFVLSSEKLHSKSNANSLDSSLKSSSLSGSIDKSNSLSGSIEKTKSVLNAPIHVRRTPSCQSVARYECEEDEILIVSSECNDEEIIMKGGHEAGRLSQSRHSFDYSYQVHWTVERLSRDMDHVMARMHTLEALVTVHRQVERTNSGPSWWPFQDLKPKTLLFVVTWPLIAHGLIALLKAAAKRARR